MKGKALGTASGLAALVAATFALDANAAPVLCSDASKNHMYVDSSYVDACVASGTGNIGNGQNDDFLALPAAAGYSLLGAGTFTQNGNIGTFSFDPALWNLSANLAIGFKFGTGNKPDEWFVYDLKSNVSSGNWSFVNVYDRGGGLSHVVVYDPQSPTRVPEPTNIGLLGAGLAGLWVLRRTRRPQSA